MAQPTLVKAFVAFRHGSRAPLTTYKGDPYSKDDKKYWPNGPSELTTAGKQEAYELGVKLRARYKNFIGEFYKPESFRAYSTLTDRTMMTAQLVLASFFPPREHQKWNKDINWQPVPVYPDSVVADTSSIKYDRFHKEFNQYIKQSFGSTYGFSSEEVELIQKKTGVRNLFEALFRGVWDAVYFQDRANLPLPDWLKPLYPQKMTEAALKFFYQFLIGPHLKKELVLGPYGNGLLTFFLKSPRKLEFFAWHEVNIMITEIMLGIPLEKLPEPASALVIELHEDTGEKCIKVYYYDNSKTQVPRQLMMPCGPKCTLSNFIENCKKNTPCESELC